jgi:hypothetical protein
MKTTYPNIFGQTKWDGPTRKQFVYLLNAVIRNLIPLSGNATNRELRERLSKRRGNLAFRISIWPNREC